jgi:spore maturation protein CgeB
MQINLFYPWYIHDFYQARPELATASFQEHIDALMADGFYAPHLMMRQLTDLGYDTRSIVINSNPAQAAWMREHGHDVTADTVKAVLAAKLQVEEFDPDILYFLDIGVMDSKFVRALRTRPRVVAGWRGFPFPEYTDLSDIDLIVSSYTQTQDEARARGVKNVATFYPGFARDNPIGDAPRQIEWDVIYSGIVTREHRSRTALLAALAEMSKDPAQAFRLGVFMRSEPEYLPPIARPLLQGPRWGQDMLRMLRNCRIVTNVTVDSYGGVPPYMRLFEAAGVGAFLITTHHPDLRKYFEPGVEIETYRTENELLSKVMYFLANPDRCEEIAAAALARCRRDHALEDRAKGFKQIMDAALLTKLEQASG